MFKKKKTFDTHCVIPTSNGILTMNQATYDYIRELERKLAKKEKKNEVRVDMHDGGFMGLG